MNNSKNDIFNQAFDLMLKEAANQAAEELGRDLEEFDKDVQFSEEHIKKMKRFFAKERKRVRMKNLSKLTRKVACIAAAFIFCLGIYVGADALRKSFLTYVYNPSAPNTDFVFNSDGTYFRNKYISIDYIPDGFAPTYNDCNEDISTVNFENEEQFIQIIMQNIDMSTSVDTENSTLEETTINGYKAVFIENEKFKAFVWADEYKSYSVFGNLDRCVLLRVCENINH